MRSNIINVWDIMNTPELLYSNMTAEQNKNTVPATCTFTPYPTHDGEMYIGINIIHEDICKSNLKYIKFCYRQDKNVYPKLTVESPAYFAKLCPIALDFEDGYTVAVFDISDTVVAMEKANISSENPYKYSGDYSASMLNLKNFNSRYMRFAIYPFGGISKPEAELKYIGFFENADDAKRYIASEHPDDFEGEFIYEKYSYKPLTDDINEMYTSRMNSRISDIKYGTKDISPDTLSGTCYYISSINGNDENDGRSALTPWKTLKNLYIQKDNPKKNYLNDTILKYGDGVFLERGSVFYPTLHTRYSGDYVMSLADGVTVSAYGSGEKPILTGAVDIDGSKNWVKTEYENIWRLADNLVPPETALDIHYNDIGHILFVKNDGTIGNGIKVLPQNPYDPYCDGNMTVNSGTVSTGFEIYDSQSRKSQNPGMLQHNLEFFHDWINNELYLYCDKGNPADIYKSVIVAKLVKGIYTGDIRDIVIDNIAIKYVGAHGIQICNSKNVTIQNCTLEWIGGSCQGGNDTRYGNGIEGWGSCDGFYILNTYVDQVYDGGLSTQFASGDKDSYSVMNDFKIKNCVVTNTNSNVELWNYAQNAICSNFEIKDNYLAYGGYHFGHQRPKKNGSLIYLGRFPGEIYENCIIENNVLMHVSFELYCGRPFLARGETNGSIVKNNVYIAGRNYRLGGIPQDLRNDETGRDVCDNRCKFTEETVSMWHSFGLDLGSEFYMYDGFYREEESTYGLYRMRDENGNIIW